MSPARTWAVEFADREEGRRDIAAVPMYYRRAVEDGLERLEFEGPCIGLRLRGSGFDRFCRYAVPSVKGDWRIIYEWPAADAADALILIYAIGAHTKKAGDVYERIESYLESTNVAFGEWSAAEGRLGCCEARAVGTTNKLTTGAEAADYL